MVVAALVIAVGALMLAALAAWLAEQSYRQTKKLLDEQAQERIDRLV